MKKTTKLKAFVLSQMMVAMMLPMTMFAQKNDNFVTDYNYGNRDAIVNWTIVNGIENDDFGAPLGSGLLILTAVGAGYAVAKRRRNVKKGTTLLIAALMIFGMTNCRKNIVEPSVQPTSGNKVAITLNVGGSSKAVVNPPHVNFEAGDKILVASNGHYVGTLTASQSGDNVTFSGSITDPVVGEPLYFYFLGNKDTGTLTAGTSGSTSCTVNISDQTNYPHLPVISMGVSINRSTGETVNYASGTTSYEAQLHNKCSLMKFNVTTTSTRTICYAVGRRLRKCGAGKLIFDYSQDDYPAYSQRENTIEVCVDQGTLELRKSNSIVRTQALSIYGDGAVTSAANVSTDVSKLTVGGTDAVNTINFASGSFLTCTNLTFAANAKGLNLTGEVGSKTFRVGTEKSLTSAQLSKVWINGHHAVQDQDGYLVPAGLMVIVR